MTVIPFATQSYRLDSAPLSSQRLVNLYAEREPPDAKTQVGIIGSPGLTSFTAAGGGPIRGMHVMDSVLYVVSGSTFLSVSSSGVPTAIGTGITGNGRVAMSDNGVQLQIVNGSQGYIYSNQTNLLTPITDPNFHSANTTTFFDNVFVLDWAGTNKVFISNSLDGTTYNGLAFQAAEVTSSFVLATLNQQETLLIFTGDHIETWYDAGAPIFPFLRVDGATIERGCAAGNTAIKEDNSVFFLGDDLVFYRLNGTQPTRISTHAVESAWRKYTTVADAFAFSYTWEGHKFIPVTFPTGGATWEYDIASGLWHERISYDVNNNSLGRWRGNCHATCYGLELIGDAYSGQIGFLDVNNFTEFGNQMVGQAVSAPLHSDRKRVTVNRLELDFQTGVGTVSDGGANPQVMLDWSKDGGNTFGPMIVSNSLGAQGAYLTRLRWLRMGQARQWVFRYTISDPVRRTFIAANADVVVGL